MFPLSTVKVPTAATCKTPHTVVINAYDGTEHLWRRIVDLMDSNELKPPGDRLSDTHCSTPSTPPKDDYRGDIVVTGCY